MPAFLAQLLRKYKKDLNLVGWEIMVEVLFNVETSIKWQGQIALIIINKADLEPYVQHTQQVIPSVKLSEILLAQLKKLPK